VHTGTLPNTKNPQAQGPAEGGVFPVGDVGDFVFVVGSWRRRGQRAARRWRGLRAARQRRGLRAARRRRGCELLGGGEGSAEHAKRLELKGRSGDGCPAR